MNAKTNKTGLRAVPNLVKIGGGGHLQPVPNVLAQANAIVAQARGLRTVRHAELALA